MSKLIRTFKVGSVPVLILVALPAIAAIYGLWLFITGDFTATDMILVIAGSILTEYGVTFGYHRLVVHKAFQANPALRAVVLALGSMTMQGPVINWAATHTKHHAMSDQEGDPHTPTLRGFLFAHFEWILEMTSPQMGAIREEYGNRYKKDPMLVFFDKTFLFWTAFGLIVPALIGGATGGWIGAFHGLLWGGLIRLFLTSHITWCVNSVCHVAGKRMFKTTDQSRNNWVIGLLALGEGWHNNHHAFPSSAFHGLKWYQIDITGLSIRMWERLGLVKKVVRIPKAFLQRKLAEAQLSEATPLAEAPFAETSFADSVHS